MISERSYPRTVEELAVLVQRAARTAESVVLQAGHFLLYYDTVEDRILPCIASEMGSPRHEILRREAGHFPSLSWALGLELVSRLGSPSKRAMIVVNDWQYIPKGVDRRRFYRDFGRLPQGFDEELVRWGADISLLSPPRQSGTAPFWGEMNLRNQYSRTVGHLVSTGKLPDHAVVEQRASGLVCSLVDAVGGKREVYCANKTGDCAAEIAQMLRMAKRLARCDCFVNLYPSVCREFVERGTELGQELLGNDVPSVLNVGLVSNGPDNVEEMMAGCEVAWHWFGQ